MPRIFPLTGIAKHFIPTAPNNFIEELVDEVVDQVLFLELEKPVASYPGLIAANTFVNEFEPETAVKLIDNFHKTKSKRRRVEYFKEVYCRNKIIRDFIRLKPTCFLIMGIPCEKHYEIGEAFAEKLSHVHINVLDLINEEIAKRTDVGIWIYTNLKMGRDIPIKLILKLLTKALKRPDVMYRGYVLTSFPILPFKKFTRDRLPIRFDDMDSVETPPIEQCQKWIEKRVKVIKYPGGADEESLRSEEDSYEEFNSESDTEESAGGGEENVEDEETNSVASSSGSMESEVDLDYELSLHEIINDQRLANCLEEKDVILSAHNQFDTLLKLDLPPDIVVFFPQNEDDGVPCSPAPSKHDKYDAEEGALETTLMSSSERAFFNELSSNKSTTTSTDATSTTNSSTSSSSISEDFSDDFFEDHRLGLDNDGYPLYVKRFLSLKDEMEQFILHYSKDMVIKIDNRYSIKEALEQLEIRMKFINYKYVNEAVPLFPDGIDEKLKDQLSKCKTKDEILCLACQRNPIIPTYFWRKGSFMTKCPVKLNQGKIVEGKIIFAVRFLGYIHFLSSFSAMKMFIRNPFEYCLCKPNCRIAVVGPRIPSITSVIKSILNCSVHDWKDNLPPNEFHQDIYKDAANWADNIIENVEVPGLDNKYYNKPRGFTNVFEVFQTATEKLMNEDDFDPTDMLSDIGLNTDDQDLVEMLRGMFTDKERPSQGPPNLRASLIPFSEILDTLVNEKFNEIFKARYPIQLAKEISRWIKNQDHQIKKQTNGKTKYARWLINDVPTDLKFWKYLEKHNTLPDVVIILNEKSPIKLYDMFTRRTTQLKDVHHIANYIINNFPVFFHDAECLLAKAEHEHLTTSRPMNPLEELLCGVKVNLQSNNNDSLENLEAYLNSKKIVYKKQELREHTLTTVNVAVIQGYFEIFKTKPLVQTEKQRKYLYEVNKQFEKMTMNVKKEHNTEYLETFKLSLAHVELPPMEAEVGEETTATTNTLESVVDLEEVSRQNLENLKHRSDLYYLPYGNTKRYCPVTFVNHNSLLHGRQDYMVEYANRYFMMSSQDALEDFINHPFKYVHDCFELVPPPFRACVAGPSVVNRHLYASKLANKMNVETSTLTSMLREYIEKHDLIHEWMRTSYEHIYEKYCDDFLGNHVARHFKKGFVFESFPTTSKQFYDMIRNHLYPELIVILDGLTTHIEQNLYNRYKHMWEDKVIWLTNNYKKSKREDEIVGEDVDIDEVHEFGPEEYGFEETGEESLISEDKFYAKIMASNENREQTLKRIREKAKNDLRSHIEGIKDVAKLAVEHNIPVIEVPLIVTRKKASILKRAVAVLTELTSRGRMFEQVVVIPLDKAEKVLQTGVCLYSHFKNLDPVDAYNLIPVNMHETMRKQNKLYACMYRRLLFYINGREHLKAFYDNPKMYVKEENPFSVMLPMRMAVLGPPYSGISTLCNRISQEFNMKVFTKEDLISLIKTKFPCSYLARNDPETLPPSKFFLESMNIVRNCSSNGFILDNYQMDPNDIVAIAKHDVALHLVLVVDADFDTVWRNWKCEYLRKRPAPYMDTIKELNTLHAIFLQHKKKLRAFTIDVRDIRLFNAVVVNKTKSRWEQWDEARSKMYLCLREIGGYFKNLDTGTCFSLSQINVFWYEFKMRLSSLKVFCPVCLRLDRKMIQFRYDYCNVGLKFYDRKCQQLFNEPFGYNMESLYQTFEFPEWYIWNTEKRPLFTNNAFRRNLIQYREHFYWSCDRHRFDLTLYTEQFLPPDPMYLPLYVPFLVNNYFNLNVQYNGNCIVTYHQYQNIVKGSRDFAVYYRGKIFLCASAECAQMFLEQPELFYTSGGFHEEDQHIDWDLKEMSINFGSLTPELIIEALTALNKDRPKHYGLNIADSAAIYVGLFLKCANPNSNADVIQLYDDVRSKYFSDCNLISTQIAKKQIEGNPFIKEVRKLHKL